MVKLIRDKKTSAIINIDKSELDNVIRSRIIDKQIAYFQTEIAKLREDVTYLLEHAKVN